MATHNAGAFGDNNAGLQVAQSSGPIYFQQARPETPPIAASTILPRPDFNLIDRDDSLDQIQAHAARKHAWIALVGLGGVGKTQLAIQYAERVRERDGNVWILWIFAANSARFNESLRDVAEQIKLPGRQDPKADLLRLLEVWLANASRRWLLVLDNVDDADVLLERTGGTTKRVIDHIPSCGHGMVLITSRRKDEARKLVGDIIDVTPMDLNHAMALLSKQLSANDDEITRLAVALDCMPLALSQAASFIQQRRRYTIDDYLTELESSRESRTSLLQRHGAALRDRDAKESIILSWQISFEHINGERRSAADLLALMSFCDRQAIPEQLLRYGSSAKTFEEDIQMLEDFSIVSPRMDNTTWDMHRLVQDAMQWWLEDQSRSEEVKRYFIERVSKVMPTGQYENWRKCEVLLPHCRSAIVSISAERQVALQQAEILQRVASLAWTKGQAAEAVESAEASLNINFRWRGEQDEVTLRCLDLLGIANVDLGRHQAAVELATQAVEVSRKLFGDEHAQMMSRLSNLASIYGEQDQHDKAEELQLKSLEIAKRFYGSVDQVLATSINNLAWTYSKQGRYAEAEELQIQVLDMQRITFGDHPETASSMGNLALTYSRQDRHDEAEVLQVKALEICERTLGEHPLTAMSMHNLALTYGKQGRHDEAEVLQLKVLEANRREFNGHPDIVTSMNNLAMTWEDQNKLTEARDLMKMCIQMATTLLGSNHPHTLAAVESLERIEMSILIEELIAKV